MADLMTALATATQAIKLVQDLRGIDKAMDAAEYKLKIAELTSALADLKITLTEARGDTEEKDAEINRLKTLQRRLQDDTVEVYGYRYRKRKDGAPPGAAGNPFCDVCLQKSGLLIEMTRLLSPGRPLQCPNCKAMYGDLRTYTD